jgi:prepilin-type N-terminal cleavage/methylation domain-containing protein
MDSKGFSLVEILIAILLLGLSLIAVVPLFLQATRSNASAAEIGTLGALASQRMELLRQIPFGNLTAGGSLTTNQTGYFDGSDPDFILRWRITDDATPPTIKTIDVRIVALRAPIGLPKEITMSSLAAQ